MSHEDSTFKPVNVDSHKAVYFTSLLIISLIVLGIVAALLCSKCKKKLQLQRRSTVAASPAESPEENEMVPPSFLYSSTQSSGMIQCLGCRSTITIGQMVRELPICKHRFHENCISTWLHSKSTCPLCQNNMHAPDEISKASSSSEPPA
ncbi:RING-H2 finger protein ATL80 [Carex littledalei]|uniref:RING-H2 finger protein ATL80 n=1 Tax=Carex littledalei TaxID=544730 RepID=A0A833VSF2_9POAL|nr:RING-H2 finger protein ATL80 [Carex littledalei]